jgi:hypothetical protein
MQFLAQFVISYAAALLVSSVVGSKSLSEVGVVAITYGIVAFPFGLVTAVLARLFERLIGWPAGLVAVIAVYGTMYLLAPHKENFWRGFDSVVLSGMTFAAVWCFLSWRHALAAARALSGWELRIRPTRPIADIDHVPPALTSWHHDDMFSEFLAILINNFWLFAIALAAAAGLAWLLVTGIRTGELRSLAWADRGTFRRDRNPLIFWLVAGIYAVASVVIAATPCVVLLVNIGRNW